MPGARRLVRQAPPPPLAESWQQTHGTLSAHLCTSGVPTSAWEREKDRKDVWSRGIPRALPAAAPLDPGTIHLQRRNPWWGSPSLIPALDLAQALSVPAAWLATLCSASHCTFKGSLSPLSPTQEAPGISGLCHSHYRLGPWDQLPKTTLNSHFRAQSRVSPTVMYRCLSWGGCQNADSSFVTLAWAEFLHVYQGDADAVDPRPHFVEQGCGANPFSNRWEDWAQRGRVTFPRYFIMLEEVS